MTTTRTLPVDPLVASWGLAGLVLASLEFQYGLALHLGEFLITLGGSDVGAYVRMSNFPSWRAALTFAGDRALGFPLFLYVVRGVVGPSLTGMCWALFGFHLLSASVFYGALRRRWGLHPAALLLLFAFPGLVAYTTAPMTDAFAADLVMLALAAIVAERPMLAGAAWGWVVLVRPSTVVPAVLVLGLMVVQQRSIRSILAVLVFALILGWQGVNCWRMYQTPCMVTPIYAANTLGWGLNLGRTNVRIYFSQHMPKEEVLVSDPWLVARAANAPLWLGPRLAWFMHHPDVLVVTVFKKTIALLDNRTRSVDERPGHAVDATPRWYRWWARLWDAAACGGVALALVWLWDRQWTAIALVPLIHYLQQSPLHVPPRYGLTAVPCALVLLVWTVQQRRPVLLAVAVVAALAFYWQVSAWDQIDVILQQIEGWA